MLWWNILVANLATNFQDLVAKVKNLVALAPVLGAISRPVKQICFPNGNALFVSLFSLSKNWMHNEVWGCAEILPNR